MPAASAVGAYDVISGGSFAENIAVLLWNLYLLLIFAGLTRTY